MIGLTIGLVLGLTGAGGSIFAVPLLMTFLDWPFTQAATVSLLAVSVASSFGAVIAWRHNYVRYRAALLIAIVGLLFSPLGIRAADNLQEVTLRIVFSIVLASVAARMYLMTLKSAEDSAVVRSAVSGEGVPSKGHVGKVNPITGRLIWTQTVAASVSCIGIVSGFLSGLLGVGGGFIIVPALRTLLPLSIHSAIATSLLAIALTSTGTFIFALMQGRAVQFLDAFPIVIGAICGMLLGRLLSPSISGPNLQKFFALIAILIAISMLIQATLTLQFHYSAI